MMLTLCLVPGAWWASWLFAEDYHPPMLTYRGGVGGRSNGHPNYQKKLAFKERDSGGDYLGSFLDLVDLRSDL